MNNGVNQIDKVLDAVLNHDRAAIGLLSIECDLSGVSEKQFEMYAPSYDTRLDLIAYDLSWLIYIKNHKAPNPDDFKKFVKYDNRGRELFQKARDIAVKHIPRDVSYQKLTRTAKVWYTKSMLYRIFSIFIFTWIVILLIGLIAGVVFPTTCGMIQEYSRTHKGTEVPQICESLSNW